MSSKLIDFELPVPEPPTDLDLRGGPRIPVLGYVTPRGTIVFGGWHRSIVRFAALLIALSFMVSADFDSEAPWMVAYAAAMVVVISAAGSLATILTWRVPRRWRVVLCAGYIALSFAMWPVMGWKVCILWIFAAIVIGVSMYTTAVTGGLAFLIAALAIVFEYADGRRGLELVWIPTILVTLSLMMSAFSRQAASIVQLQQTRHELAQLAVAEERGRVARDMHDILGHSLTAIAVKAELAGMLIDTDDAAKARAETAAVEQLARAALADVRTTVAGYRGTSVAAELANARSVLTSAGIEAEFPATVEALPADDRELAGWLVREGVTNVLRHSNARTCRIVVEADRVEVADDGRGPKSDSPSPSSPGNGLRGLRERAETAGWRVETGRSELGGFRLGMVRGAKDSGGGTHDGVDDDHGTRS